MLRNMGPVRIVIKTRSDKSNPDKKYTNITKYAQARNIWINLATTDGKVEISVRDDGVGFDPAARRGSAHGLVGMRFRVEAEGGALTVQSTPGQGTLIRARLPASTARTAEESVRQ